MAGSGAVTSVPGAGNQTDTCKIPGIERVKLHYENMAGNMGAVPQQTPQPTLTNNTAGQQPQVCSDPNSQQPNNSTATSITPVKCIRQGCTNQAITNPEWEDEYCSNECVVTHCRNVFMSWIASNSQNGSAAAVV